MLKITSIVDNTCLRHSYLAQHGQSILIQDGEKNILFDTSEIFFGLQTNLNNLQIQINQINAIVISHQHFDHCGALPELLRYVPHPIPLYIPEPLWTPESIKAQQSSYHLDTSHYESYSNYSSTAIVPSIGLALSEKIYLTGPVEGKVMEQAIALKLNSTDIVLIVGCSHPGISALVNRALAVTQASHVVGLIGGMHYKDMSPSEIDSQVEYIKSLNINFIIPSHCTGNRAAETLRSQLPQVVKTSGVGSFGVGNSFQLLPELKFDFV